MVCKFLKFFISLLLTSGMLWSKEELPRNYQYKLFREINRFEHINDPILYRKNCHQDEILDSHQVRVVCKKNKSPIFNHFNDQDLLEIEIEADFKKIQEKVKGTQTSATIKYSKGKNQKFVELMGHVESRGNYRFTSCKPKPLKIKFDKNQEQRGIFEKLGSSIKLVNECPDLNSNPSQAILREYYIYKIYELLSPMVIKTQLVKTKYINPDGSLYYEGYSIVREPEGKMLKRCGVTRDRRRYPDWRLSENHSWQEIKIFNALIGNHDFYSNHNMISGKYLDIPFFSSYDFDLSSLVLYPDEGFKEQWREWNEWKPTSEKMKILARDQLKWMLAKEEDIEKIITDSIMSPQDKIAFKKYFKEAFLYFSRSLDNL